MGVSTQQRPEEMALPDIAAPRHGYIGWVLDHPLVAIGLLAFALRLLAVAFTNLAFSGRFSQDDFTYISLAQDMAQGSLAAWTFYEYQLWNEAATFLWPLRLLFELFGPVQWIGQVYVSLWGTATAVLVTAIALRFLDRWAALTAGLLIAAVPSQVLWSSLVLKDAAVWAVLATLGFMVALATKAQGRALPAIGVAVTVLLWGMAHLREHTLIVAAWAIPLTAILGRPSTRVPRALCGIGLALLIPGLVGLGPGGWTLLTDPSFAERRARNAQFAQSAFVQEVPVPEETMSGGGSNDLEEMRSLIAQAEALERKAEAAASEEEAQPLREQAEEIRDRIAQIEKEQGSEGRDGASASPEDREDAIAPDTFSANISHLPTGLRVMLLEPLPWREPTSSNMSLARLEGAIWYPLLALAVLGLVRSRLHLHALAFPILAGGGVLLGYSLSEGNIGTAYRHRGEFVWVVALLAMLGAQSIIRNRRERQSGTALD